MLNMLGVHDLKPQDLQGLAPEALTALAAQLIEHVDQQRQQLASKDQVLAEQSEELLRKDREITLRDAKLEKIHFELARLKRWKFGARTEAMNTEQRAMFQETLLEDEASLQAQLTALQAQADAAKPDVPSTQRAPPRKPRRQALPEHLRRVEHHHEPEDTACPTTGCGQPMARVGEDVSEKLDIVPVEFFVHRHICGKWACRCCERLMQEPADPQIIDGGIPARRWSRCTKRTSASFWDRRCCMPTRHRWRCSTPGPARRRRPTSGAMRVASSTRSRASSTGSRPGAVVSTRWPSSVALASQDIEDRQIHLGAARCCVTSTPATGRCWISACSPIAKGAGCLAHARRKYEEIAKAGNSAVAKEAIERLAATYHVEGPLRGMDAATRQQARQQLNAPLFKALHAWLQVQRRQVPDGGAIAGAIAYSLNHWAALTAHLDEGAVPIDNNFMERQLKPWQMGRKAWLFIGSELAGQRAAVVMSLVQSVKLNGHEPWAYLRDVLARLPMHLNSRIDELLPHRWQPASAGDDT